MKLVVLILAVLASLGCQRAPSANLVPWSPSPEIAAEFEDDLELDWNLPATYGSPATCKKATAIEIADVNTGNTKAAAFKTKCLAETGNSPWCDQLMRPNPESINSFYCTYGSQQPHQLIHPDEATWPNAITAVKLVQELQAKSIQIDMIYNWWRPEPYNENVGGAAGRHPFGTSVDVRFKTKVDQENAHVELCKMRAAGRLQALGYYSSTSLHLGVGDHTPNTWGKSCP